MADFDYDSYLNEASARLKRSIPAQRADGPLAPAASEFDYDAYMQEAAPRLGYRPEARREVGGPVTPQPSVTAGLPQTPEAPSAAAGMTGDGAGPALAPTLTGPAPRPSAAVGGEPAPRPAMVPPEGGTPEQAGPTSGSIAGGTGDDLEAIGRGILEEAGYGSGWKVWNYDKPEKVETLDPVEFARNPNAVPPPIDRDPEVVEFVEQWNARHPERQITPGDLPNIPGWKGVARDLGVGLANAAVNKLPEDLARASRAGDFDRNKTGNAQAIIDEQRQEEMLPSRQAITGGAWRKAAWEGPQSAATSVATTVAGAAIGGKTGAIVGGAIGGGATAPAGGVGAAPGAGIGATVGGIVGAGALSGTVFYRMAKDSFMEEILDKAKRENVQLTDAQWNKIKEDVDGDAFKYAMWEAGPEAVSSAVTQGLFSKAGTKLLAKVPVLGQVFKEGGERALARGLAKVPGALPTARFGGKLAADTAEEAVTEGATYFGQEAIRKEHGLRETDPSLKEFVSDQLPNVVVGTLLQGGAMQGREAISDGRAARGEARREKAVETALEHLEPMAERGAPVTGEDVAAMAEALHAAKSDGERQWVIDSAQRNIAVRELVAASEQGISEEQARALMSIEDPGERRRQTELAMNRAVADQEYQSTKFRIERQDGNGNRIRSWRDADGQWWVQRGDELPWAATPAQTGKFNQSLGLTDGSRAAGLPYIETTRDGGEPMRAWQSADGRWWYTVGDRTPTLANADTTNNLNEWARLEGQQAQKGNNHAEPEQQATAVHADERGQSGAGGAEALREGTGAGDGGAGGNGRGPAQGAAAGEVRAAQDETGEMIEPQRRGDTENVNREGVVANETVPPEAAPPIGDNQAAPKTVATGPGNAAQAEPGPSSDVRSAELGMRNEEAAQESGVAVDEDEDEAELSDEQARAMLEEYRGQPWADEALARMGQAPEISTTENTERTEGMAGGNLTTETSLRPGYGGQTQRHGEEGAQEPAAAGMGREGARYSTGEAEFKKLNDRRTLPPGQEPVLNDPQTAGRKIQELFDVADETEGPRGIVYDVISEREREMVKTRTGLEIKPGTEHVITSDGIIHAINEHGGQNEESRGQVPITREDFARIPEITRPENIIKTDTNSRDMPLVFYSKRFNGNTIVVQEYRNKRGQLAFVTMWKTKGDAGNYGEAVIPEGPQPLLRHSASPDDIIEKTDEKVNAGDGEIDPGSGPGRSQSAPRASMSQDSGRGIAKGREASNQLSREVGRGVKVEDARRQVEELKTRWPDGPRDIRVVQSEDEVSPEIRMPGMEGAFDPETGTVWIVADNLSSEHDAAFVAIHEVERHWGLRAVLGVEGLDAYLDRVIAERGEDVRAFAKRRLMKTNSQERLRAAAEEWMAARMDAGEFDGLGEGLLGRLWSMVARAASRLMGRRATDRQIGELMLAAQKKTREPQGRRAGETKGKRRLETATARRERARYSMAEELDVEKRRSEELLGELLEYKQMAERTRARAVGTAQALERREADKEVAAAREAVITKSAGAMERGKALGEQGAKDQIAALTAEVEELRGKLAGDKRSLKGKATEKRIAELEGQIERLRKKDEGRIEKAREQERKKTLSEIDKAKEKYHADEALGEDGQPLTIRQALRQAADAIYRAGREVGYLAGSNRGLRDAIDTALKRLAERLDKGDRTRWLDALHELQDAVEFCDEALAEAPEYYVERRAEIVRGTLTELLGADRYEEIRRASGNPELVLEDLRFALDKHMRRAYGKALARLISSVNPSKLWNTLDGRDFADQWEKLTAPYKEIMMLRQELANKKGLLKKLKPTLGPEAIEWMEGEIQDMRERIERRLEANPWKDSQALYRKLFEINAASKHLQQEIKDTRGVTYGEAGREAKREIETALDPLKESKIRRKTPKQRGVVKHVLVDGRGDMESWALTMCAGDEQSVIYQLLYERMRKADTAAKGAIDRAHTALDNAMEEMGIGQNEMREWSTVEKRHTIDGWEHLMTDAQIMDLYLLWGRDVARRRIMYNGTKTEALRGSNEPDEDIIGFHSPSQALRDAEELIATLSPKQIELAERMRAISAELTPEGSKTSIEIFGYDKFRERNYWPMRTDRSDKAGFQQFEEAKGFDAKAPTDMGMLEETVPHGHPILIENVFDAFDRNITQMARFAHMAIPIMDAKSLLNHGSEIHFDEHGNKYATTGFQDAMVKRCGSKFAERIKHGYSRLSGMESHSENWNWFQRKMAALQRLQSGAKLAFRVTSILFGNRMGGSAMMAGELAKLDEALGVKFAARTAVPVWRDLGTGLAGDHQLSGETKKYYDALMSNGYFADRWKENMARTMANLPTGESSRKGMKTMLWRRTIEYGLQFMAKAEQANAIRCLETLVKDGGYSMEAAVDMVEKITRNTQNPSSALEETGWYTAIQKSGMGAFMPFFGQPSVAANVLLKDVIRARGAMRRGVGSRKAWKNVIYGTTELAVSAAIVSAGRALVSAASKGLLTGGGDEEKRKKWLMNAFSDFASNLTDSGFAGAGKLVGAIFDQVANTSWGSGDIGSALSENMVAQSVKEATRAANNWIGFAKEGDQWRLELAVMDTIEAVSSWMGAPTGGFTQAARVASGLAGHPLGEKPKKEPKRKGTGRRLETRTAARRRQMARNPGRPNYRRN